MAESGFTGAAGRTKAAETTIWCAGCGTWFGGRWWATIDGLADADRLADLLEHGFGGINRNHCPACGASYVVAEPVVVHRPDAEQLLLVIPPRRMHRAQHARAALIAAVADDPGVMAPAYAREPLLVAGVSGLRGLVGEVTRVSAQPGAAEADAALGHEDDRERAEPPSVVTSPGEPPAPTVAGRPPATHPERDPPGDAAAAGGVTIEVEPIVDAGADTPGPADTTWAGAEPPRVEGEAPQGLLAALMHDSPSSADAGADAPGLERAQTAERWTDAWALDGDDGPVEVPVEHEPTRISRMVAPRARLAPEQPTRLVVDDGDVLALFRVGSAADADALLTDEAELRFQLLWTGQGPAICLTLIPADPEALVCWVVDPEVDAEVLDRLGRRFAVALEAVDGEGALVGRRLFDPPLARNVALARLRVERAGGSPLAARQAVAEGAVDRVGQLRHNFQEDAFAGCRSVAEAHLALGIIGFWSEPEREAYLLEVQSFPQVWFEAIVRRVLAAALDFGLMPPPHLEPRAIALGLASDARGLASRALSAFAELNLSTSIKANDLDPIDNYENWEALINRAEALGLAVDAGLRGLALGAMEAARRASEALDASEDPIELDLEDALEFESIDEAELIAAPVDEAKADPTEPLTDLIDGALVGLLADPARRASAAAVLLQREDGAWLEPVADALGRMTRAELLQVLPMAVGQADGLAGYLAGAIRSPDPFVRRALTLFLAEARRPEAILGLVDQLLDARDAGWPMLALALAGYGGAVRHLVAGIPLDGDGLERVAGVLARLPPAVRETVYDAGARQSPLVMRCLARAEDVAAEATPAPTFAQRLEEALAMLGAGDTRTSVSGMSARGDGGPELQ